MHQLEEERALPGVREGLAAQPHTAATSAEPHEVVRTNRLAIAALVVGILWLFYLGSVLALVFGYTAKRQIDESGGLQGGRRMAVAGIVLGWIGVGILPAAFVGGFIMGGAGA